MIQIKQLIQNERPVVASESGVAASAGGPTKAITIDFRRFRLTGRTRFWARLGIIASVTVLLFTIVLPSIEQHFAERHYDLTARDSALLPTADNVLQGFISRSTQTGAYRFQYQAPGSTGGSSVGSSTTMLQATFPYQAKDGVSVTDPVNKVDFTLKPQFDLAPARQSASHVYYPFLNGGGQLVYSPQAANVMEDLVLRAKSDDSQHFDYALGLGDNLAARLQPDGSVGIYGSSLATLGTISTGNSHDAGLLHKAQVHATKDKLLFSIPPPTVRETGRAKSQVRAKYALLDHGTTLRINATNLKQASYPMDIDPTVSVSSVSQLFRDTNGESNVDFNTTNGTINRGAVTGGVFSYTNGWSTNANSMANSHFDGSATVSNGYLYEGGGVSGTGSSNQSSLEYAQVNTANNSLGTWSTASLPAALSQYQLVSYNGYLYALGGSVGSTGCASPSKNVYYNPTQPNGAIASTWTSTTQLPAAICSFGATIYNNTIYVVGGQTAAGATHGSNTVYYASLLPNGAVGTWNTSSVTLPVSLYGADLQVYNGYLYVIGGYSNASTTTTLSTVYRAALNSDGSIYGSGSANWVSLPNTFAAADGNVGIANAGGGSFTAVSDGYMYVSGGCKAITSSSQTCTSVNGTTYIAQINADGTLGPWSAIASSNTDTEVGGSLLSFGGYLYVIGGCSAMNSGSFACNSNAANLTTQYYTAILSSGQIGPVSAGDSMPAGVSLFEESAVVNNGYLYLIGGCVYITCQSNNANTVNTSASIYYAPINADGSIGSWTTSTKTINATGTNNTQGVAAAGAAVYDNYIYLFGGYNYNGDFNKVWYAPIGANGDITANFAQYTTAFSTNVYSSAVLADRGYVYSFGGCYAATNAFGCTNYITTTYRIAVGVNGITAQTSGNGVAPTLPTTRLGNVCTSQFSVANDCYPGNAAMGVALYNGYVYLAGGASSGNGQSVVVEYAKLSSTGTLGAWTAATNYLPMAIRRTAAYAYNGYLYVVGGHDGDTNVTQQTVDIGKINLATGNLNDGGGIYSSSSLLSFKEWDGALVFNDGSVYEAGGCTVGNPPTSCTTVGGSIQSFQIYNANNGGTAVWSNAANSYATNVTGGSAVAAAGYIYNAGGCTTYTFSALGNCTAVTTATSYAKLNPDGSMNTWAAGPTLPTGSGYGCMVANAGYLYYIGGADATNTALNNVYISQIGANGVPGAWTAGTSLPGARGHPGCDTFDGTIYVAGGASGSNSTTEGTDNNTVYYVQPSTSNGAISSWTTGTAFTTGRRDASVVAAGGYLYVIGGYSNSGTATYYNDVQFDPVTPSTGALGGTWTATRALPTPVAQTTVTAANGYIFVSGGASGATTSTCQATTYIASINNTGELSTWTQGTNATNFSTPRFGAAGAYYNGYYYVLGGYGCNANALVSANVIQYGGEQSQSMNSFFTRYADLTGNALPQKFVAFVANAQVNSTDIESWKMAYVTSSTANNSWGVSTLLSPLVSGSVYNVNAYDGTGTNIQLAQWVSLAYSISMEKSFTFTDDTQPNVSAYYLYYSPFVGSRLRNGKTFQDEQQQGFDLNLH